MAHMFPESRYRFCTVLTDAAGRQYLDEREPFRYVDEPDNVIHVARAADTWWGLAHRYFPGFSRACGLWWLLCEFQPTPVIDPTLALVAGTTVVIPSARLVRLRVFSPERRRYH
jgi:hypothetical protein